MTAQAPDRLIYKGEALSLFSNPLEAYWSAGGRRPRFVCKSTDNWRGYVATWEIRSDTLLLIEIVGTALADRAGQMLTTAKSFMDESIITHRPTGSQVRQVALPDVFPNHPSGVQASWFSGELRVPQGTLVQYEHMGYESIYEHELVFTVQQGRVIQIEKINTGEMLRRQVSERMQERAVVRPTVPNKNGWVTCPHCQVRFTIRDKNRWDGEQHRSCGGRIDLKPSFGGL